MGRKLCIVGFSELSRDWANEQPDDVEIWGMNEAHKFLKRYDRWFQIHPRNWNMNLTKGKGFTFTAHCNTCGWEQTGKPDDPAAVKQVKFLGQVHANKHPSHEAEFGVERIEIDGYGRTAHHLRWLKKCQVPVYQQEIDPRIPTSVRYPFEAVTEALGLPDVEGRKRLYLTSSPAWMVALALYEHKMGQAVSDLRLPGVEMLIGTEYARQKPCIEFWLGLAMGMGIEFVRPPTGSSLLSDAIYAIDHVEPIKTEDVGLHYVGMPDADAPMVQIK